MVMRRLHFLTATWIVVVGDDFATIGMLKLIRRVWCPNSPLIALFNKFIAVGETKLESTDTA